MLINYSTITEREEIVGRSNSSSSSSNPNQQTASIIVVTAAMTSTSMTPSMSLAGTTRSTGKNQDFLHKQIDFLFSNKNCFFFGSHPKHFGNISVVGNTVATNAIGNVSPNVTATLSNVTGLATISMPASNLKIIKYPRYHQTF